MAVRTRSGLLTFYRLHERKREGQRERDRDYSNERERKRERREEKEERERERERDVDYSNESRFVINLLNTFTKNLLNQLLAYLGARTHSGLRLRPIS